MEKSFFISGIGGQGIQLLGKALAYAANECDLNLCLYPYYAGQRRGGITFVRLTISDGRIGAPEKEHYDYVALCDQFSYDYYNQLRKPNGIVLIDSDLVKAEEIEAGTVYRKPFTSTAEATGNPRNYNLILAGFIGETTKMFPNALLEQELLKMICKTDEQRKACAEAFAIGVAMAKE